MKYKIYHIKGIKIGCSINPKQRVKKQGYSNFEILEEHDDIETASQREIELQNQYGYKNDHTLYKQTISSPTIEGIKKGSQNGVLKRWMLENPEKFKETQKKAAKLGGLSQGKILAQKNVESGWISNLGKSMAEKNNIVKTCPYCNITTRGAGYSRWHGEKCKFKEN